jgi:hypothetical protein
MRQRNAPQRPTSRRKASLTTVVGAVPRSSLTVQRLMASELTSFS